MCPKHLITSRSCHQVAVDLCSQTQKNRSILLTKCDWHVLTNMSRENHVNKVWLTCAHKHCKKTSPFNKVWLTGVRNKIKRKSYQQSVVDTCSQTLQEHILLTKCVWHVFTDVSKQSCQQSVVDILSRTVGENNHVNKVWLTCVHKQFKKTNPVNTLRLARVHKRFKEHNINNTCLTCAQMLDTHHG